MSLRSRMRGLSPGASQAFKAMKLPLQQVTSPTPEYLTDKFLTLKQRIQDALLGQVDQPESLSREDLRRLIQGLVDRESEISPLEKDAVVRVLVDEILGYGPIQPLLDDPAISEVMINGPYDVYVEQQGEVRKTPVTFRDEAHLRAVLEKMLAFTGRRVDETHPMVDARLPDGSRLNAVLRPIAVSGDSVTIRKFSRDPLELSQLVEMGTLSSFMAEFLQAAVRGKLNIVVSGGTGSGKTTTLNALSAFIGAAERIVTIEDAAELQLQQVHKVRLEARPANLEGRGEVTIRHLVRNALRMRPDRIIVGEVRGGEALDMLQAMNTGHEGSLTTVHANSPRDALSRIETMVMMAGMDIPLPAIRTQVASAIDIIVHQSRLLDGSRRILQITEVVGMENGVITTQDLFQFEQLGVDDFGRVVGRFKGNGIRPRNADKLRARGVELSAPIFGGE
ncbi:MAG: CpaF family protein [Sulfobacillus sp.]|nr:CpaF family protein [Sulfobacillus sp.]